jgi:translation elongation factor EF-Ts
LVAKLRAETGQGYNLCREALQKGSNDLDKARTILETLVSEQASKTQLKAAEKEKSQGLIGIRQLSDTIVAVFELRCLTDFVAKSQPVLQLGNQIFDALAKAGASEINTSGSGNTMKELSKVMQIENVLNETVGKVKEPLEINHLTILQCDEAEASGTYIHQPVEGSNFGSVAAFVALQCPPNLSKQPWTKVLANQIAKHVAGMKPDGLDTLVQQPFLFNPELSVSQHISMTALEKEAAASEFSIKRFHRFSIA